MFIDALLLQAGLTQSFDMRNKFIYHTEKSRTTNSGEQTHTCLNSCYLSNISLTTNL